MRKRDFKKDTPTKGTERNFENYLEKEFEKEPIPKNKTFSENRRFRKSEYTNPDTEKRFRRGYFESDLGRKSEKETTPKNEIPKNHSKKTEKKRF